MNGFIDFWINVEPDMVSHVVDIASKLGYSALCIEDKGFDWRVKRLNVGDYKIVLVKKKTLIEAGEDDLKEKLRGIKTIYPIVSVKPIGIQAARLSARDGRVDTVVLDKDTINFIDKTQARMMKEYRKILEVPLNSLLKSSRREKAMIYRRLLMFYYYGVPIIYSSGACEWNELMHPRSIIELLSSILDVDPKNIALSISSVPREILLRNGVKI